MTTSYHEWEPILTAEQVFEDSKSLQHIEYSNGNIFWTESRPSEEGRTVLMSLDKDGNQLEITPSEYYVRNRVHEYGGKSFTVYNDTVYFSNFEDQRLYKQDLNELSKEPVALTPGENSDGSVGKYAAPQVSPDGSTLIFVYEKEFKGKENFNAIGAIDLTIDAIQEANVLVEGNDFYADPKFSPDGDEITWLTWDHPYMPWDSTYLQKTTINGLEIGEIQTLAGGEDKSITSPKYSKDGEIYFVMDKAGYSPDEFENYWNIYRLNNGEVESVTQELVEFGMPLWTLGFHTFDFTEDGKIVGIYYKEGEDHLVLINPENGELTELNIEPLTGLQLPYVDDNSVYLVATSPTNPISLIKYHFDDQDYDVIEKSFTLPIDQDVISEPKLIKYVSDESDYSFAHLYEPKNPNYEPPEDELPPVLVKIHGGPTGRASTALNPSNVFWTSQGYAILDIDYRGSVGYGRDYRDKLLGEWGVADQEDIRAGIEYVQEQNITGSDAIIRGGSAGGYAVQRALTYQPDLFTAGGSYYGIGDLKTLAKLTHKFESRYLDRIIGGSLPEDEELYEERSPINDIDKIKSPLILFQGAKDKIVTPENSREIAEILDEKGIKYEYHEYENETHGFREKENLIDCLNKEADFYRRFLG